MIAYVKGVLVEKGPSHAVVDVSGVGFAFAISLSTYEDLPPEGSPVLLEAHAQLREDAIRLFGFSSSDERAVFRILLGVPGVGPKLALAILSTMRPDRFRRAVTGGDTAGLSRIPGIGKKSAERLVVELRGRFEEKGGAPGGSAGGVTGVAGEARLALEALGFRGDQASRAIDKALGRRDGVEPTVEELVREALSGV